MPTIENTQMHLIDQGSGPAVLFLHGNPDTSEIWRPLIEHLGVGYRSIAPDLPGFGRSTAPAGFDCSLDHMAAFIDSLVVGMSLPTPLTLVVHDIGGQYGLAWAARHPQKVERIVVFNTAFSSSYRWTPLHRIWRTPLFGELAQRLTSRRAFAREMKRGASKLSDAQVDAIFDRITPSAKRMALRIFRSTQLRDFLGWEDEVRRLLSSIPSLVLWSDDDPYIGAEFADRFGARHVSHYKGFGHWLPLEATDLVGDELRAFLAPA
uniref:Haloalkane dehalogenase n=1 Tax=uncultured bacterium BLR1 TaxID=506512 RepID=B5L5U3_9BACT|nr:haloalkane dehalogenase [uncultured bacterium BLR1]